MHDALQNAKHLVLQDALPTHLLIHEKNRNKQTYIDFWITFKAPGILYKSGHEVWMLDYVVPFWKISHKRIL